MQSCILAQKSKFSSQLVVEISAKLNKAQCSDMGLRIDPLSDERKITQKDTNLFCDNQRWIRRNRYFKKSPPSPQNLFYAWE